MKIRSLSLLLLLTGCGGETLELTPVEPVNLSSPDVSVRQGWLNYPGNISEFADLQCYNWGNEIVEEYNSQDLLVTSGALDESDAFEEFSLSLGIGEKVYGDLNGDGCDDVLLLQNDNVQAFMYEPEGDYFEQRFFELPNSSYLTGGEVFYQYFDEMLSSYGNLKVHLGDISADYADDILAMSYYGDDLIINLISTEESNYAPILSEPWVEFEISNLLDFVSFNHDRLEGVKPGKFTFANYSLITLEPDSFNQSFYAQLVEFDEYGELQRYNKLSVDFPGYSVADISSVHALDVDQDGYDELVFITDDFSHLTNYDARRIFVVDGEQLRK